MGRKYRHKKIYSKSNKALVVAISNSPPSYTWEYNGNTYDFDTYRTSENKDDLAWMFCVAAWTRRTEITPNSMTNSMNGLMRFYEFLIEKYGDVPKPGDLSNDNILDFIHWLRFEIEASDYKTVRVDSLSENTKQRIWAQFKGLLSRAKSLGLLSKDLDIPSSVFKGIKDKHFKPYSGHEKEQIISACKKEIEKTWLLPHNSQIRNLLPHALLITIRTGLNPEVLFNLDVDCLKEGFLPGTTRLVLPTKARAGRSQNIELQEERVGDKLKSAMRIRSRVVPSIEEVTKITELARSSLDSSNPLKNKLWLVDLYAGQGSFTKGDVRLFSDCGYYAALRDFVVDHDLVDRDGKYLDLNFRRLRPTFAESMLKISGGDIRDLQKRLGHKNLRTTMRYLDPDSEDRIASFKFAGVAMQGWALGEESESNLKAISQHLGVSQKEAKAILTGEHTMLAGRCKNPMESKLPGKKDGELCTFFLGCFRCGNMMVFKEDAHRLFSFYHWLLDKKLELGKVWTKNYQWVVDVILNDIAPMLGSKAWIDEQIEFAQANRHPLWANNSIRVMEAL